MIKTDNITVFQHSNNGLINIEIDDDFFVIEPNVFKTIITDYAKNNSLETTEDFLKRMELERRSK